MPLQLSQEKSTAPVVANQPDILPSLTEYTPRMVEVSIKDADRPQGEWHDHQRVISRVAPSVSSHVHNQVCTKEFTYVQLLLRLLIQMMCSFVRVQ